MRYINTRLFFMSIGLFAQIPCWAAEVVKPTPPPPAPGVSTGSLIQVVFSLALVVIVILLVAWLLKRMNITNQTSNPLLKVLGSAAIGQRERVVLLEVHDTCVLVGVGPGQIRTLHSFDKPENLDELIQQHNLSSEAQFSKLLSNVIKKRKQDVS